MISVVALHLSVQTVKSVCYGAHRLPLPLDDDCECSVSVCSRRVGPSPRLNQPHDIGAVFCKTQTGLSVFSVLEGSFRGGAGCRLERVTELVEMRPIGRVKPPAVLVPPLVSPELNNVFEFHLCLQVRRQPQK